MPNLPETGVGSRAKNREIKNGDSPINQVFKSNSKLQEDFIMAVYPIKSTGKAGNIKHHAYGQYRGIHQPAL